MLELCFEPLLRDSKPAWKMFEKVSFAAFAIDTYIRSKYKSTVSSRAISRSIVRSFCYAGGRYAAVSAGTGFLDGPSSFFASACSSF